MFEENVKFADELIFCKEITEDETGKNYVFENGEKLHLDKDTKICSDLVDRKIKIEKNGKYGVAVFYGDTIIEEYESRIANENRQYDSEEKEYIFNYDEKIREINEREERINQRLEDINQSLIYSGENNYKKANRRLDIELENLNEIYNQNRLGNEQYIVVDEKEARHELFNEISDRFGILNSYDRDRDLFDKSKISQMLENIEKLKQNKEITIKNKDSKVKNIEDRIVIQNNNINNLEEQLDDISLLIKNISNEEFVNNFLDNLVNNKLYTEDTKIRMIMALNDISPYPKEGDMSLPYEAWSRETDKLAQEFNENYNYYSTELNVTKPSYKGKDITLQAVYLEDIKSKISRNKEREKERLEDLEDDKNRAINLPEKIDKEIEGEYSKLKRTIEKAKLKVEVLRSELNRELQEEKESSIRHGLDKCLKAFNSICNYGTYELDNSITINRDYYGSTLFVNGNEVDVKTAPAVTMLSIINAIKGYFNGEKQKLEDKKALAKEELDKKIDARREERDKKIQKIRSKIDIGYNIIEPKYDRVNIGDGYINAQNNDKVYLFNGYGNLEKEIDKAENFRVINDSVIYNDGKIYEGLDSCEAYILESNDKSLIHVVKYNYSNSVVTYSSDGVELGRAKYRDYKMTTTSEKNILVVGERQKNKYFLNLITNTISKVGALSDFKNGRAFYSFDDFGKNRAMIIDTNFEVKKECDFYIYSAYYKNKKDFDYPYEYDYDYMPIYIEERNPKTNHWEIKIGYCDTNGDIIIPLKYEKYEDAKKQLEKYIKSKEKKDKKIAKKEEKKALKAFKKNKVEEQPKLEVKDSNDEIYELEDKIKQYLSKMNIPKLEVKFKLMQRDYANEIKKASKNDIENRVEDRRRIGLTNSFSFSKDTNTSKLKFKNYKNQLLNFIKQIEDNYFIVDVLDRLNKSIDILDGINIQTNDELLIHIKTLYDLYSNLENESRLRNIKYCRNILKEEKDYFEGYFFRNDYKTKCEYSSLLDWEYKFRKGKLNHLIEKFKADYEFQESNKPGIKEQYDEALLKNRYNSVLIYRKMIDSISSEIKSRIKETEEKKEMNSDILEQLKEYENIQIDYKKTPDENINEIMKKLEGVLKCQREVELRLENEKYGEYDPNRNTK